MDVTRGTVSSSRASTRISWNAFMLTLVAFNVGLFLTVRLLSEVATMILR